MFMHHKTSNNNKSIFIKSLKNITSPKVGKAVTISGKITEL